MEFSEKYWQHWVVWAIERELNWLVQKLSAVWFLDVYSCFLEVITFFHVFMCDNDDACRICPYHWIKRITALWLLSLYLDLKISLETTLSYAICQAFFKWVTLSYNVNQPCSLCSAQLFLFCCECCVDKTMVNNVTIMWSCGSVGRLSKLNININGACCLWNSKNWILYVWWGRVWELCQRGS